MKQLILPDQNVTTEVKAPKGEDSVHEPVRGYTTAQIERIATTTNHVAEDMANLGWWRVYGLRHSAIARASSAREAVEKTLNAGLIGDWEDPEAEFWTEELPDVFS